MIVRWEKRGEKFYAYLRNSVSKDGKVTTTNVYLGRDIITAKNKLLEYARLNRLRHEELLRELYEQSQGKNIPNDLNGEERLRQQQLDAAYDELRRLIDEIPGAKTIDARGKLHQKLSLQTLVYHNAIIHGRIN